MQIGLQLYTLRAAMEKDVEATIKIVSEQGYDGVELAGTYGYAAQDMKKLLEKYHLAPISAHVSLEDFQGSIQETIDYYKELGCKTLVLPYLSQEFRYGSSDYDTTLEKISEIGRLCQENGLSFAYHNHDFEFAKTENGNYALDDMYEKISPNYLQAELDTCWITVAGESATGYIRRYQNRCELVHMKDFKKEEQLVLTALGEGEMNLQDVFAAAQQTNVKWLIVEQDEHYGENPFTNTEISIRYLKNIMNGGQ